MMVIGLDPGAHGGVALVERLDDVRGHLLAVAHVTGSTPLHWYRNARAALLMMGVELDSRGATARVVLEEPPVISHRGALAGDRGGQRTWCGIGRYQGLLMAACAEWSAAMPVIVPHGEWTGALQPLIRPKKIGDGWHRIAEAERWLIGARELLAPIPKTSRIDCAEASLFALAGAIGRLPTLERAHHP